MLTGKVLLSFIIQFIRFVTRRRVVTVPDGQYRLKRNRRIRRQQKKQTETGEKKEEKAAGRRCKRSEAKSQN